MEEARRAINVTEYFSEVADQAMNRGAPAALAHSTHSPDAEPSFQHGIKRPAGPRVRPAGLRRFPSVDSLTAAPAPAMGPELVLASLHAVANSLKSYFVTTR